MLILFIPMFAFYGIGSISTTLSRYPPPPWSQSPPSPKCTYDVQWKPDSANLVIDNNTALILDRYEVRPLGSANSQFINSLAKQTYENISSPSTCIVTIYLGIRNTSENPILINQSILNMTGPSPSDARIPTELVVNGHPNPELRLSQGDTASIELVAIVQDHERYDVRWGKLIHNELRGLFDFQTYR